MPKTETPFHSGELAAQHRAGAGDIAVKGAPFIRDFMPAQHRAFYQAQPFLVMASCDAKGRVWTTLVEGADGFVQSPSPRTLTVDAQLSPTDPVAQTLGKGADVGVIGIELASRRRNRLSGRTRQTVTGFAIDIQQTFGNCPQYINERDWWRTTRTAPDRAAVSDSLTPAQIARIGLADTLFIGSGHHGPKGAAANGFDASHRGGDPGFVRVISPTRLRIPDYSGNNFFNTIGNLSEDPRVGLLFVDFATGGLLHLTGRAVVDWSPDEARDPSILRMIDMQIDAVIDRRNALALRWSANPAPAAKLVVADKVAEAEGIASFHLAPADGGTPALFLAGQHLPIALDIPAQDTKVRRSYSLSGSPGNDRYRITVKREPDGVASRFLHDNVKVGDVIETRPPAGDFLLPDGRGPLVLASAGIGLTPMLAMLHHTAEQRSERTVWFVHGVRNGRYHAFRNEIGRLIATSQNARLSIYFSAPEDTDQVGRDFDVEGRVTADALLALNAGADAQYLLCGPVGFVTDLKSGLETAGVNGHQIHFETFGSGN